MKLIPKIFGSSIILLILYVCTYMYTHTESYFSLYPTLDTVLPPEFSETDFNNITLGMTRTKVLELLGNPLHRNLESSGNSDLMSQSTWSYGNDGRCSLLCDLAWIQYQINFDPEGKVTAKKRTVFHD